MPFLLLLACLVASASAQTMPPAIDKVPVPETVVDLGRGVHVITGVFTNTTVIEEPRGLVVIDTQFTPRFAAIRAPIRELSSKPVLYVINTQYHYDHTGGNAVFHVEGAHILAQANVARRMAAPPGGGDFANLKRHAQPIGARVGLQQLDCAMLQGRMAPPEAMRAAAGAVAAARVPVLVVSGGWSPVFDFTSEVAARLTGGRFEIVAAPDHFVQASSAEAFNALIDGFMREADARG